MPRELSQASQPTFQTDSSPASSHTTQHGPERSLSGVPDHPDRPDRDGPHLRDDASFSVSSPLDAADKAVDVRKLDEKLRRLRGGKLASSSKKIRALDGHPSSAPAPAGQRISEYERAMTPSSRGSVGFQVVKSAPGAATKGRQLNDLPNEILTQVFSHLYHGSHDSVALVSKRFYALITLPHAWRMAFLRFFPGNEGLRRASDLDNADDDASSLRLETRAFSRLTTLATWRSEYLLRTRLLRSIASGKPGVTAIRDGGSNKASKSGQSGKKSAAVITYNTQLPWMVNRLHAVFSGSGKKYPRVVHGASDFGVATASNPTIGKLESWGYHDTYAAAQLDEVMPHSTPYGEGSGPTTVPNVMDVSHVYGAIVGEGFVGGRPLHRSMGATAFIALEGFAPRSRIPEHEQDVPYVSGDIEAVCSVWIAKSPAVPSVTQYAVGMLAGSSLGVVSAYSFGKADSASRYAHPQVTARWVLSPGVPIIAITADDSYTEKRQAFGRIWAVALNALGEVFYLQDVPIPPTAPTVGPDQRASAVIESLAWQTGRTARWELIEETGRVRGSKWFDEKNKALSFAASASPRSSSEAMGLTPEQWIAEAREIEKFLRIPPPHFRSVYDSWDMHKKLEVDFASASTGSDSSGTGTSEHILVISRGNAEKELPAKITRFTRLVAFPGSMPPTPASPAPGSTGQPHATMSPAKVASAPPTPGGAPRVALLDGWKTPRSTATMVTSGWQATDFSLKGSHGSDINCTAVDLSQSALVTPFEDALLTLNDTRGVPDSEVPGRRSRWIAAGTNNGTVLVWNVREPLSSDSATVRPLRAIHTDSPEVTSVAVSSLYLVHGGSDGLVQAWDPLSSAKESIRTLNSRSSGRVPHHVAQTNSAIPQANFAAVGAIFVDPDPTVLRGVLAVGAFLRYWSYSSTGHSASRRRQRRLRHTNVDGQLASRRLGVKVSGHIAAETAELQREKEQDAREQAWLLRRFGVGLAGLTEEEALSYAAIMSQEAFLDDEQRRSSDNSSSSMTDQASSFSSSGQGGGIDNEHGDATSVVSVVTVTPEPSMSGRSPPNDSGLAGMSSSATVYGLERHHTTASNTNGTAATNAADAADADDDFELQIQRAIRLSLMEGVNEEGGGGASPSPYGGTPATPASDLDFPVTYQRPTPAKRGSGSRAPAAAASSSYASMSSSPPLGSWANESGSGSRPTAAAAAASSSSAAPLWHDGVGAAAVGDSEEDDLQMALRLSMQEEEERQQRLKEAYGGGQPSLEDDAALAAMYHEEDFPALEVRGKGKGKHI